MPAITNSTIIKHAKPICKILRDKGQNWTWDAQAALIVKYILEESGNAEMAVGADYKNDRQEWANNISKMGFPKNHQNVYLAQTVSGEVDANGNAIMLMPKVEGKEKLGNEFA